MTAHSATNTSTEIRQSDSNRFGLVIVELSIVGCSRLGVKPEFIAEVFIIRECGNGAPPRPCGAEPRHHTTSIRSDPARNTVARHFAVNLQDSRHRTGPGKSLRLLIATLFHLRAQYRIKQHSLQTPPDLKHIF